jgi:hypothetical protein
VFNLYDLNVNKQKYLLRGDWHGGISVWNLNDILSSILKFFFISYFSSDALFLLKTIE